MLRVGVLGATGTAGGAAVDELRRRGHDVVALGRSAPGPDVEHRPLDVVTGEGLESALTGLDALVDCLNARKPTPKAARAVLVDGLGSVLAAAERAGVGHVVSLSIVGCDRTPMGYYAVKIDQEALVRSSPVPATVVRATQFHELVDGMLAATRRTGLILVPSGPLQPVDARDVAGVLADAIDRGPGEDLQVGGPEIVEARELAGTWRARRGSRRPVVRLPAVGATLRAVAAGSLTEPGAPRGARSWAAYLDRSSR